MTRRSNVVATCVISCAAASALTGCGPGYKNLPLPGSGVAGPTYTIDARFNDALNLSRGAQVKVNGLLVGRVQQVTADGYQAVAELKLKKGVILREGSTARLRYDTPLGEPFIQLNPSSKGTLLADGAILDTGRTETAPTVEDTLAEASLLINGGGLDQLQTITTELNDAIGGNESTMRSALERARVFLSGANASSEEFDAVLRSLRDTSKLLGARHEAFQSAIRELGPAAAVLRANTKPLVSLLAKSERLTRRANHMLGVTRTAFRTTLVQLGPILDEILSTKSAFVAGLTDIVYANQRLALAVPGDYMPLDATIDLNVSGLLGLNPSGSTGGSTPSAPALPDLLGLLGLTKPPSSTGTTP